MREESIKGIHRKFDVEPQAWHQCLVRLLEYNNQSIIQYIIIIIIVFNHSG